MVDTNKKLPKHAWDDDEIQTEQGWVTGEQDILGSKSFKYAHPDKPDDFSLQETLATGSYRTVQFDSNKKQIETSFNIGQNHAYTAGGKSTQVDGHIDKNGESTIKTNSAGDNGETAKTKFAGYTDKHIVIAEASTFKATVALSGASGATKSFATTYGDNVNEHTGNWHEGFERDHVSAVTGNKVTMIKEGDYAIHTAAGNYDLQVSKGQLHLMTSAGNLIANSNVKVLLQVGAMSKVTVEPARVRLEVGGGSYIEITAGKITLKSPRIDLN